MTVSRHIYTPRQPPITFTCKMCGKEFIRPAYYKNKGFGKYCSRNCAAQTQKGKHSWNYGKSPSDDTRKKMSESHKGKIPWNKGKKRPEISMENHPNWNGGRIKNHQGYTLVLKPEYYRSDSNGYIREQILIVEKYIGRKLKKSWVIHHINQDKSDNRPENLFIFETTSEHTSWHGLNRSGKSGALVSNLDYYKDNKNE